MPQPQKKSSLTIDLKPNEKDDEPSTYTSIPELEDNEGGRGASRGQINQSSASGAMFNSISSIPGKGPDVYVSGPSEGLSDSVIRRWNNPDFNPDELFASQHLNQVFLRKTTRNGLEA